MISKKMTEALNKRINEEIYSAYLYLSMASHATVIGLKGFASWFQIQVREELFHAQKIYNYVLDQDTKVTLGAIAKPPANFKSPTELFEKTLAHEKGVTAAINKVVDLARQEKDHATEAMLQWFVTEQVEEEAMANDVLQQLKLVGTDGSGLFMIDRQLATRTFTPPPAE
ncbi:MAG: ferritin [Candidatus Glassbacteria bacterium]